MVSHPILIVDDEVEMRIAMSETLKHCGYPVELSHNAIDALKKFKNNEYSLVITDMTMPKRSGFATGLSALVHLGSAAGLPKMCFAAARTWVHSPIAARHTLE